MKSVIAAQNQPSPPPATPPPQRTVVSDISSSFVPVIASQYVPVMPVRFLWGMPPNFVPEGYTPTFAYVPISSPVPSMPPLIVHIMHRVKVTIYHYEPFEDPDVYEKMDEMKD